MRQPPRRPDSLSASPPASPRLPPRLSRLPPRVPRLLTTQPEGRGMLRLVMTSSTTTFWRRAETRGPSFAFTVLQSSHQETDRGLGAVRSSGEGTVADGAKLASHATGRPVTLVAGTGGRLWVRHESSPETPVRADTPATGPKALGSPSAARDPPPLGRP